MCVCLNSVSCFIRCITCSCTHFVEMSTESFVYVSVNFLVHLCSRLSHSLCLCRLRCRRSDEHTRTRIHYINVHLICMSERERQERRQEQVFQTKRACEQQATHQRNDRLIIIIIMREKMGMKEATVLLLLCKFNEKLGLVSL